MISLIKFKEAMYLPITLNNEKGNIFIDDEVIATIAGLAAIQSYGIVGMASKNAADGFFQLLKFENFTKGIFVDTENQQINIRLHIIVEFGTRISTVGQNIIDRVKFNVESMTGLEVDHIEVFVEDIRMD